MYQNLYLLLPIIQDDDDHDDDDDDNDDHERDDLDDTRTRIVGIACAYHEGVEDSFPTFAGPSVAMLVEKLPVVVSRKPVLPDMWQVWWCWGDRSIVI